MGLSYKARRRWALAILVLGLPAYVVVAATVMSRLERPPVWLELLIYVALGVVWALPFRAVFRGIARPDPGASADSDPR
jgi:uncharacterized protein (DUF983 family)